MLFNSKLQQNVGPKLLTYPLTVFSRFLCLEGQTRNSSCLKYKGNVLAHVTPRCWYVG